MTDNRKLQAAILDIVDKALLAQSTADYHDRPGDAPDSDDVTIAIMTAIAIVDVPDADVAEAAINAITQAQINAAYLRGRAEENAAWHRGLVDRDISN